MKGRQSLELSEYGYGRGEKLRLDRNTARPPYIIHYHVTITSIVCCASAHLFKTGLCRAHLDLR